MLFHRWGVDRSQRRTRTAVRLWLAALLALGTVLHAPAAMAQVVDPTTPSGSPLGTSAQNQNSGNQNQNNTRDQVQQPTYDPYQPVDINGSTTKTDSNASTLPQRTDPNATLLDLQGQQIKPPAKPSEYEQYIQQVSGRKVKRFGIDLIVPAARDFAVPSTTAIPPDYALNVGDTVSIALTGSVEGSANFEIDRNGRIFLPKVGSINLTGVRYRDLRDRIADAVGRRYRGYEVTVSITKLRGVRVYVTGFANNPGAYTVNSLSTLVNAVLAAGGPNAGGSFRSVKLIRNGREVADFDLYDFLRNGDRSRDPLLQNEDVLFIPPVGGQVAVIGSVNDEAIYEAKPGETLEDLLRFAGGPNNLGDQSRVILYRLSDKGTVGSREIARSDARSATVDSGDILQILSSGSLVQPLERQQVLVRIEGEVNKPGNYYVAPNTPLETVLGLAGGLTSRAYVYGAKMVRATVRAQQRQSYLDAIDQLETTLAGAPLTGDRTIDSGERGTQIAAAKAVLDKLRKAEPDGRLVLSIPYGSTTLPGDLLLENNDRLEVPPLVRTVGVFGAVYRPASFRLTDTSPRRVKDYVELAGGTLRVADRGNIFVVRASGEVVSHRRGALNARVQPGDVVFVPVKTQSSSLLAKIRDFATIIGQLGFGAAALAAIK